MKVCPYGSKQAYKSEREAKNVRNIRGRHAENLRVYRCPHCYYWHLTAHDHKIRG